MSPATDSRSLRALSTVHLAPHPSNSDYHAPDNGESAQFRPQHRLTRVSLGPVTVIHQGLTYSVVPIVRAGQSKTGDQERLSSVARLFVNLLCPEPSAFIT